MTSKYLFKKLQTPKEANLRKFLRAISSVVKDTNYANADHTYKTDANGRVNLISGKLELKTRDRNTYQQSKSSKTGGIKDGRPRDDGGHLIASTFSGAGV
jgi:hypothetical protein